jgi:hypothetical protein
MFDRLTAAEILLEERGKALTEDVVARIRTDIAHGLAPELAIASHVTDEVLRTHLQQRIAAAAYLRKPGPKERLQAYPHDPFK